MQALLQLPGLGQGLKATNGATVKVDGAPAEVAGAEDFAARLEELKAAMEEAGVTPETLSPELLAMLQQWLVGGSPLPEVVPVPGKSGDPLPLTALVQYLAVSQQDGASDASAAVSVPSKGATSPAPLATAIGELLSGVEQSTKFDKLLAQVGDGRDPVLPALQSTATQPAGAAGNTAALGKALLSMPVPQTVAGPGWGTAIGERLVWMAKGEMQRAELKLTPPNLGPLEIRLTINDDKASVAFVSHHAATRDAIEAALPRLREMLAQEALQLVRADVGGGQPDHPGTTGGGMGEGRSQSGGMGGGDGLADSENQTAQTQGVDSVGLRLLDLFA